MAAIREINPVVTFVRALQDARLPFPVEERDAWRHTMGTPDHGHDTRVEEGHFACFMPATGEICGIGRTREAALAAAKGSEDPRLGDIRDEIVYDTWRCSPALYEQVLLKGGDISYDHLRGALVTEEEARRAAEANRPAP